MDTNPLGISPDLIKPIVRSPAVFSEVVLGVKPYEWQDKVYDKFAAGARRIAIKSCHSAGKSHLAAALCWWWLFSRVDSLTTLIAPTGPQLKNTLRTELVRLQNDSDILKELFTVQDTRVVSNFSPHTHFLTMRAPEVTLGHDGEYHATSIQGIHAESVLTVLDEASGVDQAIWNAVEGYMASGDARMLAISNPTIAYGPFYRCFNRDKDMWETVTVSYLDAPGVSREWAEEHIAALGRESNFVRVRVFGEFPLHSTDTLLGIGDMEKAYSATPDDSSSTKTIGVDPARFGSDDPVVAYAKGASIVRIESFKGLDIPALSAAAVRCAVDFDAENLVVDADGIGAGVFDLCRRSSELRDAGCKVISYQGSTSPMNKKAYYNRRAELHFLFRAAVRNEKIRLIRNENLEMQATSLKFQFTEKGRIQIERKENLKKRIGSSPDELDAVTLALVPYLYSKGSGRVTSTRRDIRNLFRVGRKLAGVDQVIW